jgi:hypothetical protein
MFGAFLVPTIPGDGGGISQVFVKRLKYSPAANAARRSSLPKVRTTPIVKIDSARYWAT